MAYPTGTGSEILYNGYIMVQSDTETAFRWDKTNPTTGTNTYTVPALHIITVISIIFCENAGNAETATLFARPGGSNYCTLLKNQSIPAHGTFVWDNKITLVGGDILIATASAGDIDIMYTFIDQNWEN